MPRGPILESGLAVPVLQEPRVGVVGLHEGLTLLARLPVAPGLNETTLRGRQDGELAEPIGGQDAVDVRRRHVRRVAGLFRCQPHPTTLDVATLAVPTGR